MEVQMSRYERERKRWVKGLDEVKNEKNKVYYCM